MTYDLRRLRLKGLVIRIPHTNPYTLSDDGFVCPLSAGHHSLGSRVLPPLLAANNPPAPIELRQAFRVIHNHVDEYLEHARLKLAA